MSLLRLHSVAALLFVTAATTPAAAQGQEVKRYAVALYHFNVQYCAGGLDGFAEAIGAEDHWAGLDTSDEGVQDAIIRESFAPLVEMYAAHPGWGADLELQGLMVDAIRARHPDLLARMQEIDSSVHFDSFHWSDELWTAQPAPAIAHSYARTLRSFDDADLRHGGAYFTQEGQFARGMADLVPPDATLLLPRNLWRLHEHGEAGPIYDIDGRNVVVAGHSWSGVLGGQDVEVRWTFMDDGELLATQDIPPYILPAFRADPEAVAAHESELLALEAQGFRIVPVAVLAAELRALDPAVPSLPPILDGSWQPEDTGNLSRWMGDPGAFPEYEHDGAVRTAWAQAYRSVRAASVLGADAITLDRAWEHLLLAGVSDSTGWNPFETEVSYAFDHAVAAEDLLRPTLDRAALGCRQWLRVDPGAASATCVDHHPEEELVPTPLPDGVVLQFGSGTEGVAEAFTDSGGAVLLRVRWSGALGPGAAPRGVHFPFPTTSIRTRSAGGRAVHDVPKDAVRVLDDPIGQPLGGGVVDLGWAFLVPDPSTVGVAARFRPDGDTLSFVEGTAALGPSERWDFWLVDAEDDALALADRLHTDPVLHVAGRALGRGPVGCAAAPVATATPFALLALFVVVRRRPRCTAS